MKSALYEVREAIKTALQGLGYSVYDRGRKVQDYPYVILGEQTEQENGDQGEFGLIDTINVEVYNGWQSDWGERSVSDQVVNGVLSLITKPYSLVISGFDSPVQFIDSVVTSTEQSESHTIVTTIITMRFQLFEQNGNTQYLVDDSGNQLTDDSGNFLITG